MEINNNDDEADNINRNLLVNNNNINNIRNNNQNNINNNNEEQENVFLSKYKIFTLSFILICISYLIFWCYSYYTNLEQYKYVFELYSIIKHNQYYRCITRYLIHFGFGHLLIELVISLYILYLFENVFGTISTLFFIISSSIICSLFQIILSLILFNLYYYFNVFDIISLHYEGGLSPILFALNTFLCSFDVGYLNENNFPIYIYMKAHFSSIYALFILAFLTPNKSFIGNLSGILTGYLIKLLKVVFLPDVALIIKFENFFGLNKEGSFYRYITSENIFMKKIFYQENYEQNEEEKKNENDNSENNNNNENPNNDLNNGDRNNNINVEQPHEEIEMSFIPNNNDNNRNN